MFLRSRDTGWQLIMMTSFIIRCCMTQILAVVNHHQDTTDISLRLLENEEVYDQSETTTSAMDPTHPEEERDNSGNVHGTTERSLVSDPVEEKCWSPKSSQVIGIFGGHDAVQYQFPYMVAIEITFDYTEVESCGGTIISDIWILTAGHCLQKNGKTVTNIIVWYDGVAKDRMRTTSHIANYFVYPHYSYNNITMALFDDIALIQLSLPLYHQVSRGVMPICYAKNHEDEYFGKVLATGWGLNSNKVPSNILQFTYLDMIPMQRCITSFPYVVQLDKKLCTYTDGTGTWNGDSGGPIVAEVSPRSYVQIGIVSFGNAARPDLYPDVYTKVLPYASWICKTSLIC